MSSVAIRRFAVYTPLDPTMVGGFRTWLLDFWKPYLRERGASLRVIHSGSLPAAALRDEVDAENLLEVIRLPGRRMPAGAFLPSVESLAQALGDAQILYVDNGYLFQDRVALSAARRRGIPVISGHHSLIRKEGVHALPWLLFGKHAVRRFDAAHALNRADAAYLTGIGVHRVRAIPISVHVDLFHPLPREGAPVRIGFLGRLHTEKGADRLPGIIAAARQAWGDAVRFAIAGDGPLREVVEQTARAYPNEVRYVGPLRRVDVPPFLAACHILLFPSRCETFGIAAAEAAACGTPTVATRIEALADVVTPESGAFVDQPDDPQAWIAALKPFVEDPVDAERSARIHAHARERFGFASVARAFDALCEEAFGARV